MGKHTPTLSKAAAELLRNMDKETARKIAACIRKLANNPFDPDSRPFSGVPRLRFAACSGHRIVYWQDSMRVLRIEKAEEFVNVI